MEKLQINTKFYEIIINIKISPKHDQQNFKGHKKDKHSIRKDLYVIKRPNYQ